MSDSSLSKLKRKIVCVPAAELHVTEGNHRILAMQIMFDAQDSQKRRAEYLDKLIESRNKRFLGTPRRPKFRTIQKGRML